MSDPHGNRAVANAGDGVSDRIESRPLHETGKRLGVVDAFYRQQANRAAMGGTPGGDSVSDDRDSCGKNAGGGYELSTTDCLHVSQSSIVCAYGETLFVEFFVQRPCERTDPFRFILPCCSMGWECRLVLRARQ